MDNHQSAREALNHLLATDTFLRGTLVPTGDVELSKRWNAARPFLDDLDENRRRARSMKALFTRNARKMYEDNQRFYNYITKEGKERTDIFMGRLIDPLPHYGSPVLTGPSMPLTNTIQVQVGSIIQVGVGITFHGRTTDFRVGQVESLNPADGSASVRFNDGKLHPMSFIGGDMAKLNYFSLYQSRDFEVPVSHIIGATLEEADNKYTHDKALKTLAEVLAQESADTCTAGPRSTITAAQNTARHSSRTRSPATLKPMRRNGRRSFRPGKTSTAPAGFWRSESSRPARSSTQP